MTLSDDRYGYRYREEVVQPYTVDGGGLDFLTEGNSVGQMVMAGNAGPTNQPEKDGIFKDNVFDGVSTKPTIFIDFSLGLLPKGLTIAPGDDQNVRCPVNPNLSCPIGRGDIFIAQKGDDAIRQYSPNGLALGKFATVIEPLYLDFDLNGNLCVTSANTDNVIGVG